MNSSENFGVGTIADLGSYGLFTITKLGNVGIGTTSPNNKLSVKGTTANVSLETSGSNTPINITFQHRNSNGGLYGSSHIESLSFETIKGASTELAFTIRKESSSTGIPTEVMRLNKDGNVGIGISEPTSKLAVNGKVIATEVEVTATVSAKEIKVKDVAWSDYVFEDDYQLKSLTETENHIKANKHLPGIPSEKEVMKDGVNVGEMQAKLLAKIEELTLHLIEQNKKMKDLARENKRLTIRMNQIETNTTN